MKSRMQAENNEMAPYSILTGHALPGGGFRTTEALHDLYIHLTDKLTSVRHKPAA
ncbi:hypothetical protein JNM87_02480 [Candidatus Saccharibacteria bacterium]|nr:hypothetical protein [Candidatus Saccharibacteria bacterium]